MNTIALAPLKDFARRELAPCPLLRQMILEEPDQIAAEEFFIKVRVWLKLLEKERSR